VWKKLLNCPQATELLQYIDKIESEDKMDVPGVEERGEQEDTIPESEFDQLRDLLKRYGQQPALRKLLEQALETTDE